MGGWLLCFAFFAAGCVVQLGIPFERVVCVELEAIYSWNLDDCFCSHRQVICSSEKLGSAGGEPRGKIAFIDVA